MSDQPTIRVESCRGDGRCPTCGSQARDVRLVCGCLAHAYCASLHQRALLTEALRQLSDQRERGDQAEAARITEQRDCREVVQRVEGERDAWWRKYNAAKVAADVMEGERDAAIARTAEVASQRKIVRSERDQEEARANRYREDRDLLSEALQREIADKLFERERTEKAEAEIKRLKAEARAADNAWVELGAIHEALVGALRGLEPSDFMLSFPEVREAWDLRLAANALMAAEGDE